MIHPSAQVDPGARIGARVQVGAFSIIGPDVDIGDGTTIGPHCVIEGPTRIGADNRIYSHAALGTDPQDKKYAGERAELVIGDRNTIREFTTFSRGTGDGGGVTRVGDDNWIMAYVHIAHDCQVGNHATMANNATLAGHVQLGDHVTVGGLTGILQRMRIGDHAMIGFASHVNKDVPPFLVVDGNPLQVRGVNLVGLRRRDFSADRQTAVREMHKLLYRQGKPLDEAMAGIEALTASHPEAAGEVAAMLGFLRSSTVGIAR